MHYLIRVLAMVMPSHQRDGFSAIRIVVHSTTCFADSFTQLALCTLENIETKTAAGARRVPAFANLIRAGVCTCFHFLLEL